MMEIYVVLQSLAINILFYFNVTSPCQSIHYDAIIVIDCVSVHFFVINK